ncbi:hypothetical protein BY458DRAFT_517444 [Sporodiniella umbellata]|nr:hypothetical protein BY458DRAFT_517444 [Sporodiniella umbellata]
MVKDSFDREKCRKIISKKLNGKKLGPNVELLIYLNFLCFMGDFSKTAEESSLKNNRKIVSRQDIVEALEKTLRKYRG